MLQQYGNEVKGFVLVLMFVLLVVFCIDEHSPKLMFLLLLRWLLMIIGRRERDEGEGRKGYFCPFPCYFANLMTWQSLTGSRDEILTD